MKIIIDSRMRKEEKQYLLNFGELIEIAPQDYVYDEISAHPDIFFCKIDDTIFRAPNLEINIGILGEEDIGKNYPEDIKYNVAQVGRHVIHNFEFTDKKILDFIDRNNLNKINVQQGYSNCSTVAVSDTACITSDIGIYKAVKMNNIDCLLLQGNTIKLLDKNGLETKMNGFIGGASAVINNKFILFGDVDYLQDKNKLLEFLDKYELELVDFKNLPIYDYGGVVLIKYL